MREALADGTRATAHAIALVICAFVGVELVAGQRGYGGSEGVVDAATIVIVLLLRSFVSATSSRPRLHGIIATFGVVCVLNIVGTAVVFDVPENLYFLAFILVGTGSVPVSWTPLLVVAGVSTVLGLPAAMRFDGQMLPGTAVSVFSGTTLAVVILRARRRKTQRATELQWATARQADELRATSARLEEELAERARAEQERMEMAEAQARMKDELAASRRLEALGTLAGGVAHDMNNVLAAIASVADAALAEDGAPAQSHEDMTQILAATKQGSALTRNLLGFARRGKRRHEPVALGEVVRNAVALLRRTLPKGLVVEVDVEEGLPAVEGDEGQLGHVVVNLGVNARDATQGEGRIDVRVCARTLEHDRHLPPGRYLELSVRDDGAGMAEETQDRVFEPFFSTKEGGDHAGLGLSMVLGTARQHDGDVRLESTLGEGTTVRLLLPVAADQERSVPAVERRRAPSPGLRVLVVDDEPLVRTGARRLLRTLGADVDIAPGGREAVARYADGERFDLVLLDMAMPEMDGTATFHALRAIDGDAAIAITSGFPKGANIQALLDGGAVAFIDKPYCREDLEAVLGGLGPSA